MLLEEVFRVLSAASTLEDELEMLFDDALSVFSAASTLADEFDMLFDEVLSTDSETSTEREELEKRFDDASKAWRYAFCLSDSCSAAATSPVLRSPFVPSSLFQASWIFSSTL